ncbi:hypothetical protein EDC01DRAFT_759995 [Geopyxis carbonaria]|nr:hypothetical protein EDC01DRAFT_759995 [Geopyxis carbonaria]
MAELIRSLRKPKMAIKSTEDRKLEGKLAEFRKWRTSHPQDKCISITMTPSQFRETTVQRLIEMRPFTFNGDDNVLILQPQIPIDFILRTFAKRISSAMVKAKWLKTQEISSLVPLTTSTIQLEGVWIKCPHAILQVKGTTIPGVIFEGAFQDSHDRLRECAAEWLSKSNGMVRVVITLKLFENDGEIYTRRKRETFDIWSNRCIKAPTVIDAAKIEEWVGSVTGYLEIWRRGKNGLPVCTTGLVVS